MGASCVARRLREALAGQGYSAVCLGEVVVYGSLVRGDYDPRVSDVDLFIVFRDVCPVPVDSLVEALRRLAEGAVAECLGGLPERGVDIAWCFEGELSSGGCDYKFLTLYRDDFERYGLLVWGSRLHEAVPRRSWVENLCSSVERVERRIAEWRSEPRLLVIAAGEAVKLALYATGYRGPWSKQGVLEALEARGWRRMAEFWRRYLQGLPPAPREALQVAASALAIARSRLGARGEQCRRGPGGEAAGEGNA